MMSVSLRRQNGSIILAFEGEMDIATVDQVRGPLGDAMAEQVPVVLDLTECTFIDSNGIHLLRDVARLERARDGAGAGFTLVGAQGQVRRVLEIVGVDRVVRFADTVAA
jgi:anti-sigma B factor antagonist